MSDQVEKEKLEEWGSTESLADAEELFSRPGGGL